MCIRDRSYHCIYHQKPLSVQTTHGAVATDLALCNAKRKWLLARSEKDKSMDLGELLLKFISYKICQVALHNPNCSQNLYMRRYAEPEIEASD